MTEWTDRERLLRVLQRQPVDRIPVSPFIHINYVKEFFGTQEIDAVEKTPEVYRHFGFDIIHRNCSPAYDPFGPAAEHWQIETRVEPHGRDSVTYTTLHTPAGSLCNTDMLNWTYEYDAESAPSEFPIKNVHDFELFERFQPPAERVDMSDIGRAKVLVGSEGIVAPWCQGAFNLVAFYYRRLDDLLMDAVLDNAFYQRMMRYFLDRYKIFVQGIIDAGADVISYAGNIANGKLVGPAFYRQHILPYEQEFVEFIQSQGVVVLHHNCGYARNLLPLYRELGIQAYESLTPPPYGDTVLDEAVAQLGPAMALLGNIDQIELLRKGTPAQIEATIREVLDTVRGRCSFILATTDYFNENTPHEAIHLLADAGRRYGAL